MALDSFPASVALRDGSTVTLTPLQPSCSGALLAFYKHLPEEDRMVLKDDVTTSDWAETFLRRVETREVISLIAKSGGKLVGEATLYRTLHGWTRHVGEIRVNVAPAFRRKGLATALASAQVGIATELGIEKIIVQVVDNQVAARRTFEKLGFHKDAVLPHHIMDITGCKRDLIVLANDVSQIWAAMETVNQEHATHQG
ncbi:MAG: GNAT family N-acetyltransferase [Holophaga sp.]|nr:GNAT family N-acetyltransferase [Holophaga sp.]